MMCKKCKTITGVIFLVLAVLFLLVDLGTWTFWGVSWWTAVFAVIGISAVASCSCKDCNTCNDLPMKKR